MLYEVITEVERDVHAGGALVLGEEAPDEEDSWYLARVFVPNFQKNSGTGGSNVHVWNTNAVYRLV